MQPLLELKTRPRVRPASLSLSMVWDSKFLIEFQMFVMFLSFRSFDQYCYQNLLKNLKIILQLRKFIGSLWMPTQLAVFRMLNGTMTFSITTFYWTVHKPLIVIMWLSLCWLFCWPSFCCLSLCWTSFCSLSFCWQLFCDCYSVDCHSVDFHSVDCHSVDSHSVGHYTVNIILYNVILLILYC